MGGDLQRFRGRRGTTFRLAEGEYLHAEQSLPQQAVMEEREVTGGRSPRLSFNRGEVPTVKEEILNQGDCPPG
ncbi:hypothetical protein Taro_012207 [Colocasia esculenta]|uniref:Uncharacterized protein n=1 Tax=Colocasia esculenta TaxID=4460 RepID=A0A843U3E7_COLES|nr:hypothetical protein [Colocasia esculenta]